MRIHIIGAGIFGLATALEPRSRNHEVCVFEQDTVGGQRASSTDLCKVIRRTNYQSPYKVVSVDLVVYLFAAHVFFP